MPSLVFRIIRASDGSSLDMYGAGWEAVGSKNLHLLLFLFVERFSFSSVFSMAFFNLFFHCGFFIFRMFSREQSSPMLVS